MLLLLLLMLSMLLLHASQNFASEGTTHDITFTVQY